MGFSCQPPVPAFLPDPPIPPKKPKSYAREMANAPREVQRLRMTGLPEYERDPDAVLGEFITHDALICIVHAALRAGRGTETVKNLNAMLEPYGIRRKA